MAYKIGYGTGELGDFVISEGAFDKVNSYAAITALNGNTATISDVLAGQFETFRAGVDCLIWCAATNRDSATFLGSYLFTKITLVHNDVLTFDKNVEEHFSGIDLDYEYLQAVTVPNFDCLRVARDATITAPPYNPFKHYGGIVILRTFNNLELYGSINLRDCGIPYNRQNALRPLHFQETAANGETDKAVLAGQENFITAERLLLNAGDGACILIAKTLMTDEGARIGNPKTHGAAYCRGAADSCGVKPSNITNIGGSTILIAADNIQGFSPKLIAKYRGSDLPTGKGLCRCFIATNTDLPHDEGLYARDYLSDKFRLQRLGVEDFGSGSYGDLVNPTAPLNNYAKVTNIAQNGHRLLLEDKTSSGLAPIKTGALLLVQALQSGKFTVARALDCSGDAVIIDKPFTGNEPAQIISIPEFNDLTISGNYTGTRKFNGIGGVCAMAVAGTLNLTDGKINVEGKGGNAVEAPGNRFDRLIVGSGAGSVFIIARKLILSENSRIGGLHSGLGEGGRLGGSNPEGTNPGGGYSGTSADEGDTNGAGGGYIHGGGSKGAGSGFSQGTSSFAFDFSNVQNAPTLNGASVFIIAGTIENFSLGNISTGGKGNIGAQNGAAGYGGGGSNGAGGNSGSCFIFT